MRRKSEHPPSRKIRAWINFEPYQTESLVTKPQTDQESGDASQKEKRFLVFVSGISNKSPTTTSHTQEQDKDNKANNAKYIVWPFVTVWRGIKAALHVVGNFFKKCDEHHGSVTAVATVVIALLTGAYAIYSQKQWQIARDTLRVSQGAYITIGTKDGIVARFITPRNPQQNAAIVMYFQNSGHVPAKVAWGTFGPAFIAGNPSGQLSGIIYTHPFKGMGRTKDKKSGSTGEQGESATIAGGSIFAAPIGEISQQNLASLPAKNVATLVMGMFQYCDELGNDSLHNFALQYHNAPDPDLSFGLVFDTEMPIPRPTSSGGTKHLSPCKTISERNKRNSR